MSEEYSNDSVTEVTTTGWLQRIVQSFVGAVIGVLLVIGSIVLLWWNEGRAVEAIRALDQGARQLVEANATAVDPANNNKLVHLSGTMTTRAPARDTAFGVGGDDLLLEAHRRDVPVDGAEIDPQPKEFRRLRDHRDDVQLSQGMVGPSGRFGSFPRGRRAS